MQFVVHDKDSVSASDQLKHSDREPIRELSIDEMEHVGGAGVSGGGSGGIA